MNTSKEKKRQEAIERLQFLQEQGLHQNVLKEFEESGQLNYSERIRIHPGMCASGILYWIDEQHFESQIREFEEKSHALVYHATHERTEFGTLLDLFFVSDNEEEWNMDREDLKDGYSFCYVMNLDYPEFSEFGSIAFRISDGGLVREG